MYNGITMITKQLDRIYEAVEASQKMDIADHNKYRLVYTTTVRTLTTLGYTVTRTADGIHSLS